MAYSQREVLITPSAADSVDITTANTATLDLDLYIIITKRLHVKLLLVKLGPGLGRLDLETSVFVVVGHGDHAQQEEISRCTR